MTSSAPQDPAQHPTSTERAQARPRSGYLPTLDGWRAIAILWVIYSHLGRHPGAPGTFIERFTHGITDWGEHGVQLFFALSGFLICTRLLREETSFGKISIRSFYVRRLFRIQPPALAYLAFLALLTVFGIIAPYWKGIFAAALMVRNIWPAQVDHRFWYTSHFWSLSVEEHFYLMLPAFLLFIRRRRLTILIITVIALDIWRQVVFSHRALQHFGWMVDLRTDVLLANIVIGSLAAVALTKPAIRAWCDRYLRPWVALLYAIAVFTAFNIHLRKFEYQAVITTYPVLLVATSMHGQTPFSRFLEWAPMRFIGRISYSLYIWQQFFMWPVIWTPLLWIHRHPSICIPLLFLAATASYYWVELPLIRIGHRLAKRYDHPKPIQAA